MEIFNIFKLSVIEAIYLIPYIILFCLIVYLGIFLYKRILILREKNIFVDDNKEEVLDVFGLKSLNDEIKFKNDLNEIKKSIESGNGQIRVEFSKAMYILKNFKDYNFFSSEDNKIIFEKLKTIIDNETEIVNENFDSKVTERITSEKNNEEYKYEYLDDGSVKIMYEKGYTIIKDNVVMESVNYAIEETKKQADEIKIKTSTNTKIEEMEKRVSSIEETKLLTKKKNKGSEKVNEEMLIDKEEIKNSNLQKETLDMNNDIENLFTNFNIEESEIIKVNVIDGNKKEDEIIFVSGNQNNKNKFLKELSSRYEEFENCSLVFILEQLETDFKERIDELLSWLFNKDCLFDKKNKFIFCDIDVEKGFFYIDANLFLFLFSKFYKNKTEIEKTLLYSGIIVNADSLKKILNAINKIMFEKYQDDLFHFIGKTKSPFTERILTYELEGEKRIISSQMIMINLNITDDEFEKRIYKIKEDVIGICKPKIYKVSRKNQVDIMSLGFDFFKDSLID
jgi:hypothetical protein